MDTDGYGNKIRKSVVMDVYLFETMGNDGWTGDRGTNEYVYETTGTDGYGYRGHEGRDRSYGQVRMDMVMGPWVQMGIGLDAGETRSWVWTFTCTNTMGTD